MKIRQYIIPLYLLVSTALFIACTENGSQDSASTSTEAIEDAGSAASEPTALSSRELASDAGSRDASEGDLEPKSAIVAPTSKPLPSPTQLPSLSPGTPFPDEQAGEVMFALTDRQAGEDDFEDALALILEAGDTRFISVLIELMRGRQIGIVGGSYSAIIETLETLSGQAFGDDWPAWVEWYGKTNLKPPPGFTGWKGKMLARIDPGFDDFLQDEHPSRIRVEEIQWGGVPIDGIPPLEQAPMIPAGEANYLLPEEPVFGLFVNGEARAYPLRIVDNHEMANDIVGGVPVSLAYCTLCGAAIAFDGRAPNGETYNFGTSGFLYRSNKLMYDRTTHTLWNQLTGEPVLGELAAEEDLRLDILPVTLSAWEDWLSLHPDTLVLDRDTGLYPADFYVPGVLYGDYFASEETMFPVWQRSDLLEDKDFVYTLFIEGIPKAYDVKALAVEEVVNDTIGEMSLVLIATQDTVTVNGSHRLLGPVTYTNGGEVRAFERGDFLFSAGPDPYTVLDNEGRPWQVSEGGLLGPSEEVLERLPGHLAYWFGWYAFFPDTLLYTGD